MSDKPSYYFLPWVRWGASASITAKLGEHPEPASGQSAIPSRAAVNVTLRLNGTSVSGETTSDLRIPVKF